MQVSGNILKFVIKAHEGLRWKTNYTLKNIHICQTEYWGQSKVLERITKFFWLKMFMEKSHKRNETVQIFENVSILMWCKLFLREFFNVLGVFGNNDSAAWVLRATLLKQGGLRNISKNEGKGMKHLNFVFSSNLIMIRMVWNSTYICTTNLLTFPFMRSEFYINRNQ